MRRIMSFVYILIGLVYLFACVLVTFGAKSNTLIDAFGGRIGFFLILGILPVVVLAFGISYVRAAPAQSRLKKYAANPESVAVSAAKSFGGKEYQVRCSLDILEPPPIVTRSAFFATAIVFPEGLVLSLGNRFRPVALINPDPLGDALQIGTFHALSDDNSFEPILLSYDAIGKVFGQLITKGTNTIRQTIEDRVQGRLDSETNFQISILYFNAAKKTMLQVGITAYRSRDQEDPRKTVELYHELLAAR